MYNKIFIIGHVGKDAEMRYTPTGKAVTNFSIAATETYNNSKGEQVKKTIWYRVTSWGKAAEVHREYVKKGMLCFVSGRLQADEQGNPRVWNDTQGKAHANFELAADVVKFLSKVHQESQGPEIPAGQDVAEEDIPF